MSGIGGRGKKVPKFLQPRYMNLDKQTTGEKVREIMKENPTFSIESITKIMGKGNSSVSTYYNFFKRHGLDAEL